MMKKVFAAVLAALLITLVFAGCASNTGKYTLSYMNYSGFEITEATAKELGRDISSIYLDLKSGNKFEMIGWDGDKIEGTYKVSGKNIELTADEGGTINGTIENKTITFDDGGAKMVFKKK